HAVRSVPQCVPEFPARAPAPPRRRAHSDPERIRVAIHALASCDPRSSPGPALRLGVRIGRERRLSLPPGSARLLWEVRGWRGHAPLKGGARPPEAVPPWGV